MAVMQLTVQDMKETECNGSCSWTGFETMANISALLDLVGFTIPSNVKAEPIKTLMSRR